MKLSPLDIRHKEFQSALNGFNKGQVRDFLARAADQFEERLEQIQQLSEQIKKQEKEIEQLRVADIELKRTLVTSERLSGEVKLQAEREAELLLKETQSQADIILRDAELQKRQLLKTAETQIAEANEARQKAEEAAKRIRQRSLQEATLQKQRAENMVAGLKEQATTTTGVSKTDSEHAKEIAKIKHNSKTIIVQLKKDIAKLKAEQGQMLEQLKGSDRQSNVRQSNSGQSNVRQSNSGQSGSGQSGRLEPQVNPPPIQQNTPPLIKTKKVANALSNSIDNLMSNNLGNGALGLSQGIKQSFSNEQFPLTNQPVKTEASLKDKPNSNNNAQPKQAHTNQLEREHRSNQQLNIVDQNTKDTIEEKSVTHTNGLSQHIYPPKSVKESSVQDRGRLITPPTVYDIENPFTDDGFDEIDSLGSFSDSMISNSIIENDTGIHETNGVAITLQDTSFDSKIFSVEDTIELNEPHHTVEHIEVLDTEWLENFEFDDE